MGTVPSVKGVNGSVCCRGVGNNIGGGKPYKCYLQII